MLEIKKLPKGIVEIKGEIEAERFESFRGDALKHLAEHVSVDGFRKGHAPASVVEKNVTSIGVLEEMAQIALSKEFPKIIKENKIDAIGYPSISITKLAEGNPLGFTITVATVPEVTLPDYKKIAKEKNAVTETVVVEEKEFEATINQVKMMRAKEEGKAEGVTEAKDLPDLDDEYVKKLGDFENVEDFKTKVRKNILDEKTFRAKDKKRLEIIEEIIAKSSLEVPEILIEAEAHKLLHKMKGDIEHMGLKYADYLEHLKKSEADLLKDFHVDAEKRAKLQLIVAEIAKAEHIQAPAEKVKEEVKKVTELYKDADPENARMYIESVLTNEEVFTFLENQK